MSSRRSQARQIASGRGVGGGGRCGMMRKLREAANQSPDRLTVGGRLPTIRSMLRLSAFADEISPDVVEQARVCRGNGVTHFELRSVDKINVLDFDKGLRERVKT